jgi:hypothetical protein
MNLGFNRPQDLALSMAERRLTILRYSGKTPSFAMCEKCRLKFFTPRELTNEPVKAEANLRQKFEVHNCKIAVFTAQPTKLI